MEVVEDARWSHPCTVMIAGPSASGKTQLTSSIVTNRNCLFNPPPQKTILYYCQWQPIYDEWKSAGVVDEFYSTFPEEEDFRERLDLEGTGSLVVFDDFFLHVESNKSFFENLFCIDSHHLKVSVILIVHNLFTKSLRTLSLNCHRFFLTQSLRDKGQLQTLARQAFPGKSDYVIQSFDDSMLARYGHLCLDFSPECNPLLRVTSNWFAFPPAIQCYVYKTDMKCPAGRQAQKLLQNFFSSPQARYLKLVSNDCICKFDDQPSDSNNYHSARNSLRLQSMEPHSQLRNSVATDWKGAEASEDAGDRREEAHPNFHPQPTFKNIPAKIDSPNLSPQTPEAMETQAPPPHPPPPLPPAAAQPLALPHPPQPSALQPYHTDPTPTQAGRVQLHQELQKAIADRSSRSSPQFIVRPLPQPLPPAPDIRQEMHDELKQAVAARRTSQESEWKAVENQNPQQKAIEYSNPEGEGVEYLTSEQRAIEYSNPDGRGKEFPPSEQKALTYSKPEKKAGEYLRMEKKVKENLKPKQKAKPKQYSNPTRALENLNVETHPESIYPSALRSLDTDIAPSVKKTKKIPKRKLLRTPVFSPSPPISNAQEIQNPKPSDRKRKGDHLSKPKPTKPKTKKLNQGVKRANNFPLKPAKRLPSYPLWKL